MEATSSSVYRWIIVPNLILGWFPLIVALIVRIWWEAKRKLNAVMLLLLAVWLLFFPNAPYVITDLVHLTYMKTKMPIHYDVIFNVFTALTSLTAGFISLYLVHEIISAKFKALGTWLLVAGLLLLCSIGVFLGRFLRWNSWDIVKQPLAIMKDSIALLEQADSLFFIGTFMVFLSLSYLVFYFTIQLKSN
ncbi:hypothetical protein D3C73_811150 [compost metagenome]